MFFHGFRVLQRRRLILDTPFSKIRSAAMGMVEISGLAVGPYTLNAPLTGRPCYYHRTLVWEFRQNGSKREWVQIVVECAYLPFFIDDNTGRVLVDPREAEIDLHCDLKDSFGSSSYSANDLAPEFVRTFLARHGIVTFNRLRVEEYCIKPKNFLFVLGTLAENPGIEVVPEAINKQVTVDSPASVPTLSLQSLASAASSVNKELGARILTARAAAGATLGEQGIHLLPSIDPVKFQTPHDQQLAATLLKAGITNPAAWSAAGLAMPQASVQNASVADKSDPNHFPPVVLMRGSNEKSFVIS